MYTWISTGNLAPLVPAASRRTACFSEGASTGVCTEPICHIVYGRTNQTDITWSQQSRGSSTAACTTINVWSRETGCLWLTGSVYHAIDRSTRDVFRPGCAAMDGTAAAACCWCWRFWWRCGQSVLPDAHLTSGRVWVSHPCLPPLCLLITSRAGWLSTRPQITVDSVVMTDDVCCTWCRKWW